MLWLWCYLKQNKNIYGDKLAENLTDIEKRVLEGVVACKTNSEIAEEIGYTERHINRIVRKLFRFYGVKKRIELVKLIIISRYDTKKDVLQRT